jgi:hypothetical protein
MNIPFNFQSHCPTDLFEFIEAEITQFCLMTDYQSKAEIFLLGVFSDVPCPVTIRGEEFDVSYGIGYLFGGIKRWEGIALFIAYEDMCLYH